MLNKKQCNLNATTTTSLARCTWIAITLSLFCSYIPSCGNFCIFNGKLFIKSWRYCNIHHWYHSRNNTVSR